MGAIFGIVALLFGATTAFAQLQTALNRAWEVTPDPNRGEIRRFFVKRLVSFGMILAIGFLVLVSLLLSASLAAFSDALNRFLPPGISAAALRSTEVFTSLLVFSALFAAMYRILPDVEILWSDALVGGGITALLFTGGKFAIGFYLGNSEVTSVYGAAGSLAVILLWTYYSSSILLFGAEITQVWSQRNGRAAFPEQGAVKVHRHLHVES